MAIEKINLDTSSYNVNAQELKEWLANNAMEYFDSITKPSVGVTQCNCGNAFLYLDGNDGSRCRIQLANGISEKCIQYGGYFLISTIIKTSKGIMMLSSVGSSIIIGKSNVGNTCIITKQYSSSGSEKNGWSCAFVDLKADTKINNVTYVTAGIIPSEMTVLCPIPLGNGKTIAEHIYITPFT